MSYIDFEWARAFAKEGGPAYEYSRGKIRQIGRGIDDGRRPLEIDQSLWSRFAKLDGRSPSACVEFAHAWGLLTIPAVIGSAVGAEEPLDLWRSEIERVGFWLRGLSAARVPFGKAKTWVTEIKVGVEMTPVENR